MTPVIMLSELWRSMFSFWSFALCLLCIFCAILSVSQKRSRFALLTLPPFLGGYLIWQILFDIHLFGKTENASVLSRRFADVAWGCLFASLLVLSAIAFSLLVLIVRFGRNSVTPTAVKRCLDGMPCGICCWQKDGRVLFSNLCMNRLCIDATGSPLLSGNQFSAAVAGKIMEIEEKRWRFTCREMSVGGETLREMIASDITDEYEKTRALERDKEELSRFNRELREYTLNIDEIVRRREILEAKVNIHDEMNRLMLLTTAKGEDFGAADDIFSLWEQNALLLCMQTGDRAKEESASRIQKLANALKIKLKMQGELPAELNDEQKNLFYSAAQESIINAAKHARAGQMTISFTANGNGITCRFVNDGIIPEGEVKFSGGLYNLSLLAKKQGASLSVSNGENFTLTLFFPKNQPNG